MTTFSHSAQMSHLASSASPQLRLMAEFERGFSENNTNTLAKLVHKDFRRNIYPRSLGIPEHTRDEWLEKMSEVVTFATVLETTNHSVIEIPGKVIIHATTNVKTSSGVDLDRESLYIAYIGTDEDGSLKIMQLDEFTDSQVYLDLFKAATEAKAKKQKTAA